MSIHDIGVELQAYLKSQGCPFAVVDGPEQTKTATWGRERVVLEHDVEAKDAFADPRGLHTNAKHRHTATDTYKFTIYAQSKKPGATPFEHRTRIQTVRETVMAGMDLVAAKRINRWKPTSGGFITPPDLAEAERATGAVYELKFTYELPIRVVTFVGDARPEASMGALVSSTNVSRSVASDGTESNTPETACGA